MEHLWPVSIKGIVATARGIVLLHNERDEWELPGGRLEVGESPQECLRREVDEETGLLVDVNEAVDAWVYEVAADKSVLVVTYVCSLLEDRQPKVSHEHDDVRLVAPAEIARMKMPDGYKHSIGLWMRN